MKPNDIPGMLFFVVMGLAALGWLALLFFPRYRWANFWFAGVIVPLALCAIYMWTLIAFWYGDPPFRFTDFATLDRIYGMFRNPGMLLVAWTNLTTMDLVVGAWMARKAMQTRMPVAYLVPCLILTFVFAGFGYALFALVCGIGGAWNEIASVEEMPPHESEPVEVSVPRST